jgi:hypothetical protein
MRREYGLKRVNSEKRRVSRHQPVSLNSFVSTNLARALVRDMLDPIRLDSTRFKIGVLGGRQKWNVLARDPRRNASGVCQPGRTSSPLSPAAGPYALKQFIDNSN